MEIRFDEGEVATVGRLSFPIDAAAWSKTGGARARPFCISGARFSRSSAAYVKRMPSGEEAREVQQELYALKMSRRRHENVVKFFTSETDDKSLYTYIATELCLCSLVDLYATDRLSDEQRNAILQKLTVQLPSQVLLRQAAEGLAFLHSLALIHRNIKPSNVMLAEVGVGNGYVIKLTDLGFTSSSFSSTGDNGCWMAPEMEAVERRAPDQRLDTFLLGLVFFYVLTAGRHPFGLSALSQRTNLLNKYYAAYQSRWTPSGTTLTAAATQLIGAMIQYRPLNRPTISRVLKDDFFKPDAGDEYPLYDGADTPGLCVIFNQRHAENVAVRDQDCNRLRETFLALGFDVYLRHDVHSRDLYAYDLLQLARSKLWSPDGISAGGRRYASLVVCLLRPESQSDLVMERLQHAFNSRSCPALHGRPKVFLVQAAVAPAPFGVVQAVAGTEPTDTTNIVGVVNEEGDRRPPIMDLVDIAASETGVDSFVRRLCDRLDADEPLVKDLPGVCLRLGLQVRMRSSLQKHLGLRKCHLERRGRLLKEDDII